LQNGKTSRLTFASPSEEEAQQIRQGLGVFITDEAVDRLLGENNLLLGKGRRIEIFLVTTPLWKLYEKVQPRHPYFIGLFVGELRNAEFLPSLHILHYLTNNIKPSVKIVADAKGEQRFLYGQTLETQEFESEGPEPEVPRRVIVVNNKDEGVGYGRLTKTKGKVQVKPRLDLGWYLRRGQ
jgi:ribosome biogenesis protein Nip4